MTNDFLVFGGGAGANVMSQADWLALAQRASGFQSGVAQSAQLNKAWRQPSIMAAVLAQFISDRTGQDVLDDGTTATILTNLKASAAAVNGDATKTFSVAPATASQHALQLGQATGRLLRTTVYRNNAGTLQSSINGAAFSNASSTFTALAATTAVDVEVQGAGGGSGGTTTCTASQVSQSGGGGSGAYGRGYFPSGFNGATVTVGLAGLAGVTGGNGGNGGSSSFGALLTAPGGTGSTGASASVATNFNGGGIGGAIASGGYVNSGGTYGTVGINIGGTVGIGGNGAPSVFGGGGTPQATTTGPGNVGPSYGSGAGGALTIPSGLGSVGSQGAFGVVIVREYA